jgi:hypothetical protein
MKGRAFLKMELPPYTLPPYNSTMGVYTKFLPLSFFLKIAVIYNGQCPQSGGITEIRTPSGLPWEFVISVMPRSLGVTLHKISYLSKVVMLSTNSHL